MTRFATRFAILAAPAILGGCSTVDSRPIDYRQDAISIASGTSPTSPATAATTDYAPGTVPPTTIATASPSQMPRMTQVRQTIFDPSHSNVVAQAGIAYFLPRQLATVTVKRSEVTLDKAIKELGEAELALAVAKAGATAAKAALKTSQDQLIEKGGIPVIRDLLVARIEEQKAAVIKADGVAEKALKDHSAKSDAVRTGLAPGGEKLYKVTVDIALLAPSADPRHGYRLNPRHSAFRDDKHKFEVSAKGLLTSSEIIAADRTADILVELATFAGAATLGRNEFEGLDCTTQNELSAAVDLADRSSIEDANAVIACLGVKLEPVDAANSANPPARGSTRLGAQGIFYRTPVDMLIRIRKCTFDKEGTCAGANWPVAQIVSVSLPQAGPISYVEQKAGPMTTTRYALAFKDGILTSYDSTRPSELLEVARTPMRMVNGFFDGASKIISIRTGQNTAQTGLTNSQTAFQQAQVNLLAAQLAGNKQLTDAELALLQSQVALQSGQLGGQTQLSAAQLSAMLALRRDQARTDAVNKCIGEQVTKGEPYDSCLVLP